MRILLPLWVGLLWVAGTASGQAASKPEDLDNEERTLRFYYVGFAGTDDAQGDPSVEFQLLNNGKVQSLRIDANALSRSVSYKGPVPVSLFREVKTDKGVEREPLSQLEFPQAWRGVVFLVFRDPANPLMPFRFHPIEYWGPSIPEGAVRILNLCPVDLGIRLGQESSLVPSMGQGDVVLSKEARPMALRFAVKRASTWQMVLSTTIPPIAEKRVMILVFPSTPGFSSVRTLTLRQFPEEKKDER